MSKKLSEKDLLNLRSGHTVWRVWGYAYRDGTIRITVTRYAILGKKVLHWFGAGFSSLKMVCKRPQVSYMDEVAWRNREYRASFLSDMEGLGCFLSIRAAERFAQEIRDGLHPEITEYLFRNLEDDEALNSYEREEYEYEYEE